MKRLGDTDYEKIYLFPNSHAGYYPGAKLIAMKVLFRKSDGRVLGAQAIGEDGRVDKRISALAVAIQMGATVYDLEEAELCYAPQFGSAKDPINFAGMVAADVLRGDMPLVHWDYAKAGSCSMCASRWSWSWRRARSDEHSAGQLRARLGELPRDREITSSAAPASAHTTRRACSCRTDSRRKTSPAACCCLRAQPAAGCRGGGNIALHDQGTDMKVKALLIAFATALGGCASTPTDLLSPVSTIAEGASTVDMIVATTRRPAPDPQRALHRRTGRSSG